MLRATLPTPHEVREAGVRLGEGFGAVASELRAVSHAVPVGRSGMQNFRKWLGWASYRFASWVNPEVDDRW